MSGPRIAGLVILLCLTAAAAAAQTPIFRWAGDAEGGAPFVEADPSRPDTQVGFDVEVAALLARGLGRMPQFVQITPVVRLPCRSRSGG